MTAAEHAHKMARSFSVIPTGKDKRPLIPWKEYQTRRPSDEECRKWFEGVSCNIGIVTGAISGLAVLDADDSASVEWCEENLPKTPTVETARGRHYYFKYRPGLKNSVAVNGLRLDIRGEGGYVIGPGSIHETGVVYDWLEGRSLDDLPLAEFPEKLFKSDTAKPLTTGTSVRYGQTALVAEVSRLAGASEGTRNAQLNRAAFSLGQLVAGGELAQGPVEAALMGTALSIGLTESEARATIKSGLEGGAREPRTAPESKRRESLTSQTSETESPIEPSLKKVSIENIENVELFSPNFTIERLIPEGEVTLLGGHGGAGKSVLALALAAHFAAGAPWFGLEVRARRALYVSLEDPGTLVKYRLKKICEVYDLPVEKVIENLTILDGSDADGALCSELNNFGVRNVTMTALFKEVKAACQGAGLIIVDNASDAYAADENSRRQVRRFVRELRSLAKSNEAGLLLLAHIDKAAARNGAQGNTYSGSTAWHNSVRSRLALTEKDDCVELVQEKLNLGKKLDRALRLTWLEGVLTPDGALAEGFVVEDQEVLDKAAVLTAIQRAISDGESVSTGRTGPKTTQGNLERFPDLPSHLRGRKGRDAFYKVLSKLQREGTLTMEEYWTPSKNASRRFIVDSNIVDIPPTPLAVEPTEPTKGFSCVPAVSSIAGTHETHENHENHAEDLIL